MNRIGIGKDIHRFVRGRPFILGGVEIPFDKGLLGHSDADAVCHAIADALLGAGALGDIGMHFPDTDPAYKDMSSLVILEKVSQLIIANDWEIANVDCTITLQMPKIAGFISSMRSNIAKALSIDTNVVSVKATTSEGLGFTGKKEGVLVDAVALLKNKQDR